MFGVVFFWFCILERLCVFGGWGTRLEVGRIKLVGEVLGWVCGFFWFGFGFVFIFKVGLFLDS